MGNKGALERIGPTCEVSSRRTNRRILVTAFCVQAGRPETDAEIAAPAFDGSHQAPSRVAPKRVRMEAWRSRWWATAIERARESDPRSPLLNPWHRGASRVECRLL